MKDKEFILESARRLERWENTSRPVPDDYADMNRDELIKLAIYQRERMEEMEAARKETDRRNATLTEQLSALTEQLRKSNEAMSEMAAQMSELMRQLKAEREESAKLRSEVKIGRRHMVDRKSQKGTKAKGKDDENRPTPHTDVKGDFDGTPESLPASLDVDEEAGTEEIHGGPAAPQKGCRLYRLGKTYRTMDADNHVYHRSDLGKLPEGSVVIKTCPRYTYDQKTVITEHAHEIVVYRDKDGKVMCEMLDIDHVCCMAHVRAKFKYAADIEHDANALRFLEFIGRLYALEKRYIDLRLSPKETRRRRNSTETMEIIIEMRSLLNLMKSENAPRHGSLMEKAVSYLDHFWNQVFLYRKDGDYTIDNSLAERCIRPLANERKNSLFFGSDKMARVSAAYHSVVSTCRLQGYSILEYLKKFFAEIVAGNRDYGKLMPSTIGISANKL